MEVENKNELTLISIVTFNFPIQRNLYFSF